MMKLVKKIMFGLLGILGGWTLLTLWAERTGAMKSEEDGDRSWEKKALIVYDPDPFYNLDEQVCLAVSKVFVNHNIHVTVATVAAARRLDPREYTIYVFCANTYNWQPDWAISNFINRNARLSNKDVLAITLGSGSTAASQRKLERLIRKKGGKIIGSRCLWLLRPNDEKRMKEPNVQVALSIVHEWTEKIIKDHYR